MPRYVFQCSICESTQTVFIRMSDTVEDCAECGSKNCMSKVYDKFFSNVHEPKEHKPGNITKKYIEDNKIILQQQKEEARSEADKILKDVQERIQNEKNLL